MINMFGDFEESTRRILVGAKRQMHDLRHPYVSSEHLLLSILNEKNEISDRLKKFNLDYKSFKDEVINVLGIGKKESEWFLYTPLLRRIIENAVIDAKENNDGVVTINHLFVSLLEEGEGVAIRILIGMGIDIDELYGEFAYKLVGSGKNKKKFIDEIGIDLNARALNGGIDPVTGRDDEINRVALILSRRRKNNPVLIGEAGVGKTAIVEALALKIVNGDVPIGLKNKRIISLDMASSVAGTKYRGEFEERMNKIIKEIEEDDNIILFIDEIHTLVGAGGAEGAIDASNIFKPALARGKIRCIGATTTSEYKKYIEKDSALERRFQKVLIEEPSCEMVKSILMNLRKTYEDYHGVIIEDDIIDLIIELSGKYIYNRNEPDRSIDILDEVSAKVSLKEGSNLKRYRKYNLKLKDIIKKKKTAIVNGDFDRAIELKNIEYDLMDKINNLELLLYKKSKKKVTKLDVANVIYMKSGIPIYEILNEKENIIKESEKLLKSNIIGQDEAISKLINISKKIKLGLKKGCYSFMFCGPSGVGKTALASLFGNNLVGSKNVMRLDMSEYRESHSVSKIIGSPPGYSGYDDNNYILDFVKNRPYCVLILDEIEKAHRDVVSLFLQVLDNGKIKDSRGSTIRFDNVVIIMTSNVGFLENNVGFNGKNNSRLDDSFSIPFMNRVDKVIKFNHLNRDDIGKIIGIKLKELVKRYSDKIKVSFGSNLVKEITLETNYDFYGARKVSKILDDKVEVQIVDGIIDGMSKVYINDIAAKQI